MARALIIREGTPHFGRSPGGSLGYSIFLTQDIVLKFIKTYRMGGDIFLIIGTLSNPVISDGQVQGGIGIGQDGYPFIGMDSRRIV